MWLEVRGSLSTRLEIHRLNKSCNYDIWPWLQERISKSNITTVRSYTDLIYFFFLSQSTVQHLLTIWLPPDLYISPANMNELGSTVLFYYFYSSGYRECCQILFF